MDELSLIVDGIRNKIARLIVDKRELSERYVKMEEELRQMQTALESSNEQIRSLKEELAVVRLSRNLEGGDSQELKQKINELLREIEQCYTLLNK